MAIGIRKDKLKNDKTSHNIRSKIEVEHRAQNLLIQNIETEIQPRKYFDETKIKNLAENIKNYGLFSPILVMESSSNPKKVTLISGERRFMAFKHLHKTTIPAFVLPYSEDTLNTKVKKISENHEREALNVIEMAESLYDLKMNDSLTTSELASIFHLSIRQIQLYIKIAKDCDNATKKEIIDQNHSINHIQNNILSKENTSKKRTKKKSQKKQLVITDKAISFSSFRIKKEGENKTSKEEMRTIIKTMEQALVELKKIST